MPASLVNLGEVTLDETASKYLETKGKSTGKAYEKCLKRFTLYSGRPFKEFLITLEAERKANLDRPIHEKVRPGEDTMRGFIKWHEAAGYSNYATLQALGAIQNILKYYGIQIGFEFITKPAARPQKENDKHEWELDQIKQFVEAAEYWRDKAYIMVAFQSGLSISDILDLNYGDIKREYEAGIMPLAIEGYREKTNVKIRTFIGYDALYYLRHYLESRPHIKQGEPIFTLLGTEERATPISIQTKLRDYAAKLDFIFEEDLANGYNPCRPHSLRSAFRSRLTGKMDGTLIECLMAHDIGQEKATYMNQPLDELREIYANYEHLLSINKTSRQAHEDTKEKVPESIARDMETLKQTVSRLAIQNTELGAGLRENEELKHRLEQQTLTLATDMEKLRGENAELEARLSENEEARARVLDLAINMDARLKALEKPRSA